jgi:transposase
MSIILPANTKQLCLVPSDPGWLLPADHPVRFFNQIVENELNVSALFEHSFRVGKLGRPSYDPVMLLKIVLVASTSGRPGHALRLAAPAV